ncbi:hypothetical protein BN190_2780002 [Clostridioides difficile T14]|nr:hypothetical protein BN169_360010 [Clostridioides difficile E16]CCL26858.1 hypothetical protein BN173_240006 [Clostridioides difficile T11]CCL31854.1 hypothetical protein BN174_2870025 [Clostridioides difficile E15]CCL39586.1 hypothetical protein BN176_290039 [Clostridioides difficile E19]CCL82035.1 hypothetical protein BN187_330035 [Clostridioides difficile E12]CCL89760.1 hypothetical protein BN189_4560001 [Clostridioides difficile T10]CCL91744.1 hypothetical protein BN190_2780002 [Clostr
MIRPISQICKDTVQHISIETRKIEYFIDYGTHNISVPFLFPAVPSGRLFYYQNERSI